MLTMTTKQVYRISEEGNASKVWRLQELYDALGVALAEGVDPGATLSTSNVTILRGEILLEGSFK